MFTIKALTILFVVLTVAFGHDLEAQESCHKKSCAGSPKAPLTKKKVDINTNSDVHLFLLPDKHRNSRLKQHLRNSNRIRKPNRKSSGHCYGFSHLGKLGDIINEEIENTDSLSESDIRRAPRRHYSTRSRNTGPSNDDQVIRKLAKRPRECNQ